MSILKDLKDFFIIIIINFIYYHFNFYFFSILWALNVVSNFAKLL